MPKMNRNKVKLLLLIVILLFFAGCSKIEKKYDDFINEKVSEIEESDQQKQDSQKDESDQQQEKQDGAQLSSKLVPEMVQVEQDLKDSQQFELGSLLFATDTEFKQEQDAFSFKVDQLRIYDVNEVNPLLKETLKEDDVPKTLLLMHVVITNQSNHSFYFPINEVNLSYRSASGLHYPSTDFYPSQSGNLVDILKTNNGEIQPNTPIEGYLIFDLDEAAWKSANLIGSVYLNIVPPVSSSNDLIGIDSRSLGQESPLYLPVNELEEIEIVEHKKLIQDRLITEWWGDKKLLAEESLDHTIKDEDVSVTLNKIEVSDFKPFKEYEGMFKNFPNGQVIVTIEYEVTNNSQTELLPIDGNSSLIIDDDPIESDYLLINEMYGKKLSPNKSMKVIKVFALDRLRYQEVWQDKPVTIAINVPEELDKSSEDSQTSSDDELNEGDNHDELDQTAHSFVFEWQPKLSLWMDKDYQLMEKDESSIKESEEDENDTVESTESNNNRSWLENQQSN